MTDPTVLKIALARLLHDVGKRLPEGGICATELVTLMQTEVLN